MKAQLRTLVLTDLVGSTALVETLGDRRAARIGQAFDRVCRDLLAAHNGQEIDKTDGFLLLFESALDAVRFAVGMHEGLAALSKREGVELSARCGVHVGEVILRQNTAEDIARGAKPVEVEGLAKPVAARVMSLAQGGRTLLSRSAYQLARRSVVGETDAATLRWIEHGPYQVKGLAEPLLICEVTTDTGPIPTPPGSDKVHPVRTDAQKRRPARSWAGPAGVAALGLVLAVPLGLWLQQPSDREVYYESLVLRSGHWVGWRELPGTPPPTAQWVRVHEVDGKAQRITLGPEGTEPASSFGANVVAIEQHWDEDRVVSIDYLNAHDRVLKHDTLELRPDSSVLHRLSWKHESLAPTGDLTAIGKWVHERDDERGWPVETMDLLPDGETPAGMRRVLVRDERGRRLRESFQDADGNPVMHGPEAALVYEYSETRPLQLNTIRSLGLAEQPVSGRWDCPVYRFELDVWGRATDNWCETAGGEAAPFTSNPGVHRIQIAYGETSVVETQLGLDGAPTGPHGRVATRIEVDERGLRRSWQTLDADGQLLLDAEGIATWRYTFDEHQQLVQTGFEDVHGDAVWHAEEGWGQRNTFNERGQLQSVTWLGPDGAPMAGEYGAAMLTYAYDADGRPTGLRAFDADNQPTLAMLPGILYPRELSDLALEYDEVTLVHGVVWEHTADSRWPVAASFVDTREQPTSMAGVARRTLVFDEHGQLVERRFFDGHGEPTLARTSAWQTDQPSWCYGERRPIDGTYVAGNTCLGPDGAPMVSEEGFATRHSPLPVNRISITTFTDADGDPVTIGAGYAKHVHVLDARGLIVRHESYDAAGQPSVDRLTECSVNTGEFDVMGRLVRACCFDTAGLPATSTWGGHCYIDTYDAFGGFTGRSFMGANGEPVASANGLHKFEWAYSSDRRQKTERYWDSDGQPWCRGPLCQTVTDVDEQGQETRRRLYGLGGELVDTEASCADTQQRFDPQGRLHTLLSLDADGAPCARGKAEAPEVRYRYDIHGNPTVVEYFDGQGAPRTDGPAVRTRTFDAQGNVLREALRNADGSPVLRDGCAAMLATWDARGRQLTSQCVDAEDAPMPDDSGIVATERLYGRHDGPLSIRYLGLAGEPVEAAGVHEQRFRYDQGGRRLLELRLDAAGEPAVDAPNGPGVRILYSPYGEDGREPLTAEDVRAALEG